MSYRSKISVNPNISVQGLQSNILSNIYDLNSIQIENQNLSITWSNSKLTLFNATSISASSNLASNSVNTYYLTPEQEITFFGGVSDPDVQIFIDISFDNATFFDSNTPVVKNSSDDFSINFHSQAPFIRLRFLNNTSTSQTINKAYACYKIRSIRNSAGAAQSFLEPNANFVTK